MEKIINVWVNGSEITQSSAYGGIQGENLSRKLRIYFDDEWGRYGKQIFFFDDNMSNGTSLILMPQTNEGADNEIYPEYCEVAIPGTALGEGGSFTYVIEGSTKIADDEGNETSEIQRSVKKTLRAKDSPSTVDVENVLNQVAQTIVKQAAEVMNKLSAYNYPETEVATLSAEDEATAEVTVDVEDKAVKFKFGIPQGVTGGKGDKGDKGDSGVWIGSEEPPEGYDVWLDPDGDAAFDENMNITINAKMDAPEVVNSIDECIDTSKVYVLPDGYIYAYMLGEKLYTNQIPLATDTDGNIYNSIGYKTQVRLSSSGADSSANDMDSTGFIPCKLNDTVRLKGIHYNKNSANTGSHRICVYDEDKNYLGLYQGSEPLDSVSLNGVWDDNGNLIQFTIGEYLGIEGQCAYIRICGDTFSSNPIVTVNEEMTTSIDYSWTNTGHAFVPADYEDRIINLENETRTLKTRVDNIITNEDGANDIPDYITTEAERVANLIQNNRNAQSLVFAACSDFHCGVNGTNGGDTKQSILHTGMGIKEIRKYAPLDFVALFGDYVAGGSASTIAGSKEELKYIHKCMYDAGNGIQQIWMQGNHDRNPYDTDDGDLTTDELYSYIGANNTGTIVDYDNPERIYGYKDFEQQKIRVIYLNSSDITGATTVSDHMFSAAQLNWLINTALNFGDKDNPTDWGIVIMSHMPLNWMATPLNIIDAYISGGSVDFTNDGTRIYHNFKDAVCAEMLCFINGHTHNFRMSQIGTNSTWQIAVPQVCASRYNEYGTTWSDVGGELDSDGNPIYWYKTSNSAESTSFVVFVIDRKNKKISAVHYGAGIDREIQYKEV